MFTKIITFAILIDAYVGDVLKRYIYVTNMDRDKMDIPLILVLIG